MERLVVAFWLNVLRVRRAYRDARRVRFRPHPLFLHYSGLHGELTDGVCATISFL